MSTLKSFEQSPLKGFVESPCKARNHGDVPVNLGFIIVNCFKAHVGFEKECPLLFDGQQHPCIKHCPRLFLKRTTIEHASTKGLGGVVDEFYTHTKVVKKDRFSLLETVLTDVWGGSDPFSNQLESWIYENVDGFANPIVIDSITDSETGYSFSWHTDVPLPDGTTGKTYGDYTASFEDEYTFNDPNSAYDLTKDLAGLWEQDQFDHVPWPDFNDPLVKQLSVDQETGLTKRYWTIKIHRTYDGDGQILTSYNVMPFGAGATVWPPVQPLFVQFWTDTGGPKPAFFDDQISYDDPLTSPIFTVQFGFYPFDPATGDVSPDAFLGNWFTYGTKMIVFDDSANFVDPAARNMRVRVYSRDWGFPNSKFKYTSFMHGFAGDPFFGLIPPNYPTGCAQVPDAPYSLSFGSINSYLATVDPLPAPQVTFVDWMDQNNAVKVWLYHLDRKGTDPFL